MVVPVVRDEPERPRPVRFISNMPYGIPVASICHMLDVKDLRYVRQPRERLHDNGSSAL